jgi:phytoene/squalene synthetase
MKLSLAIKQPVGHQRVQVRMKVEIFAEGVDRHHDGWNAIVRRVANAACIAERITQKVTHALMRDAAELLEQSAVKSKVRPQLFFCFALLLLLVAIKTSYYALP